MIASPLILVLAVPVLAAAAALWLGILWWASPARRAQVAARYPLRTLTWVMAVPAFLSLAMLLLVLGTLIAEDGWIDGTTPAGGRDPVVLAIEGLVVAGLVAAVALVVLAHRVPRSPAPGWWRRYSMVIVAGGPVLAVLYGALGALVNGQALDGLALIVLAAGAGANALLAVPVQRTRAAARTGGAPGATGGGPGAVGGPPVLGGPGAAAGPAPLGGSQIPPPPPPRP